MSGTPGCCVTHCHSLHVIGRSDGLTWGMGLASLFRVSSWSSDCSEQEPADINTAAGGPCGHCQHVPCIVCTVVVQVLWCRTGSAVWEAAGLSMIWGDWWWWQQSLLPVRPNRSGVHRAGSTELGVQIACSAAGGGRTEAGWGGMRRGEGGWQPSNLLPVWLDRFMMTPKFGTPALCQLSTNAVERQGQGQQSRITLGRQRQLRCSAAAGDSFLTPHAERCGTPIADSDCPVPAL